MELTEFERMARGIPSRWFAMITADLRAYIDDSETLGTFSVLAGFSASYADWLVFNEAWREALRKDDLGEFKAHDLEGGVEEFKRWAGQPDYRANILNRFVSLICDARTLHGAAAVVDLKAYDALKPRIQVLREPGLGRKKAADPFFLAMQFVLGALVRPYRAWPPSETVRVTFDKKPRFEGKALALYNEVMADPRGDICDRLYSGPSFDDSKSLPGLQAADLIAYEVKKMFEAGNSDHPILRPAMKRLAHALLPEQRLEVQMLDEEHLGRVMVRMEDALGHLVNESS